MTVRAIGTPRHVHACDEYNTTRVFTIAVLGTWFHFAEHTENESIVFDTVVERCSCAGDQGRQ